MVHELKIKECFWKDVWNGRKTFEIRKNDRNYKVGDVVHFHVIDETENEIQIEKEFNDKYNNYVITYVFNGGEYGLDKDYCIFGIRQWIQFEDKDDELIRVRDLVSLLQNNPLDNVLCAENEESEPYDILDVLKGNGTTQGFTYVQVRLSDLE